jgi:hypothetical protein
MAGNVKVVPGCDALMQMQVVMFWQGCDAIRRVVN